MSLDLLIQNTSEVLCVQGHSPQGGEGALTVLSRASVGVKDGLIAYVGPADTLPPVALGEKTELLDARGGFVGPGFVDAHTHAVFGGERSREFDLRCQGATYLELAKSGGGIMGTVDATRSASVAALAELARPRLGRLLEHGVTTAEVKSGYGLSLDGELKQLHVVELLTGMQPVELVPTLLCAHAVPAEHRGQRDRYVSLCVEEIIPAVAERKLARFCDVFVEEGAFTLEEARRILRMGMDRGLRPKLHADQLSDLGACQLASELKAVSADHLEHISQAGAHALASGGVAGVLLPTATLFLRQRPFAPGRLLVDAGVKIALATNLNPGSAMSENVGLTLGLACLENGLTAAEAYWAFTRGAALAVDLPSHGQIKLGGPADLVIFSCASYRHLPYHLGINHVRTVVKRGRVVVQRTEIPECVGTE